MLNHFNCSRSHKMAVSKNTSPSPQLSSFFPSPLSPPTSVLSPLLCATSFLYPLPPLPRSLPHSLCVLCQRLLQCRYSVKRACQQLDLSLDPVHIPSSPSLWSYFDPSYTAQKGIHLIDFLCFNVKVAWASHYLIACFILLVPEKRLPVSTSPKPVNKARSMLSCKSLSPVLSIPRPRFFPPSHALFIQSPLFSCTCLPFFLHCSFPQLH